MNLSKVRKPSRSSSTRSAPSRPVPKTVLNKLSGLFLEALNGDSVELRPSAVGEKRRLQLSVSCRYPTQTEVQFTIDLEGCQPMQISLGNTNARQDLLDLRRLLNSGPNSISESRHPRVEDVRSKLEAAICRCSSFKQRVLALTW